MKQFTDQERQAILRLDARLGYNLFSQVQLGEKLAQKYCVEISMLDVSTDQAAEATLKALKAVYPVDTHICLGILVSCVELVRELGMCDDK